MKELFEKLCISLANDKAEKRWGRFILKWLVYILAVSCMAYVIAEVLGLVFAYKEEIAKAIGMVVCIGILYLGFSDKKKVPEEEKQQENDSILSFDENALEDTYGKLQHEMFFLMMDNYELLNLRKPLTCNQIEAISHYDIVGKVPVYHFLYEKAVENINTDDMERILENIINVALEERDIMSFPPSFPHGGVSYPSIMVHNVRNAGPYVQINLVITSDDYLKVRKQRKQRGIMRQQKQIDTKDKDF